VCDPDGLVEFQRVHRDFQLLDLVQEYVLGLEGRESYKRFVYSILRSFFMHNRVPLPRDWGFRVRGWEAAGGGFPLC